jgi:hypothetical protein
MDVDLALLADAATIDSSGKLNILGVFDRLSTSSFPARHPRMALVLRFSAGVGEMGRHSVSIHLKEADGQEVFHIDGEMQLSPGAPASAGSIHVPHVLYLEGVVFPRSGRYAFDVKVDGEHYVSVPLAVVGPSVALEA